MQYASTSNLSSRSNRWNSICWRGSSWILRNSVQIHPRERTLRAKGSQSSYYDHLVVFFRGRRSFQRGNKSSSDLEEMDCVRALVLVFGPLVSSSWPPPKVLSFFPSLSSPPQIVHPVNAAVALEYNAIWRAIKWLSRSWIAATSSSSEVEETETRDCLEKGLYRSFHARFTTVISSEGTCRTRYILEGARVLVLDTVVRDDVTKRPLKKKLGGIERSLLWREFFLIRWKKALSLFLGRSAGLAFI